MKITRCLRCGQAIFFIKTPVGKHMPCDAKAVHFDKNPDGRDSIVNGDGEIMKGTYLDKPTQDSRVGFRGVRAPLGHLPGRGQLPQETAAPKRGRANFSVWP